MLSAHTWAMRRPLLASTPAHAVSPPNGPAALYLTAGGRTISTAQPKGHRTLLWLLSTWCGSCAAGLQAMASEAAQLVKSGLRVVMLRNYRNGGYPDPDIRSFVDRFAPGLLAEPHWTFAQASRGLSQ
ncbi:thiol-disulfide oxidoreductase, partial [mine drainage metagenome]